MRLESAKFLRLRPGVIAAAVAGALVAAQAQAVGMGAIEVKSKLNEPFVAEIPLNLDYSGQADDLVVHMASPEEFERVGLQRPHEMSANLSFKVTRNARGEAVVLVTTPQKMTDPYVSFLLEAEWGNGKMVREYTAMLTPPHVAEVPHVSISAPTVASTPMPAPTVSPPQVGAVEPEQHPGPASAGTATPKESTPGAAVAATGTPPSATTPAAPPAPEPVATVPPPAPEPAPEPYAEAAPPLPLPAPPPETAAAPEPVPSPATPAAPAAPAAAGEITVAHGQTLSQIAGQVDASGTSVNRVMIALQRANPNAFIDNNINRLKAGAVLHVPDADAMRAITAAEANALVHEQVESWRRGIAPTPQLQPGEAAAAAAPAGTHAGGTTNASTTAARPRSGGVAQAAGPKGARLQILPPAGRAGGHGQSGSAEGGSGSEVHAELAQAKEDLASRQAQIKDLKAHVADLEKIKADSQKMIGLKDSQLAALQQRLAELEKKDAAATAAAAGSASAASPASASAASPAASTTLAAASAAASTASVASPSAAVASSPKPKLAHAPPAPPREPESPWYQQVYVLIGAGLILFGGLLGLMLRRPKKAAPPPRRRNFDLPARGPAAWSGASGPAAAPQASAAAVAASHASAPTQEDATEHEDPEPAEVLADSGPHGHEDHDDHARVTAEQPVFVVGAGTWREPEPAAHEPEVEPVITHGFAEDAPAAPVAAPVAAPMPESAPQAIPSPPDGRWTVPLRIDAAQAYIENGDLDSARSMLEAALIDGNAAQQEQAFRLLDMLDNS